MFQYSDLLVNIIFKSQIDTDNFFDEIYEDDNSAHFNFVVYSTSVRPIEAEQFYNTVRNDMRFLNPAFLTDKNISSIKVAIADNLTLTNSLESDIDMDTVVTEYQSPSLHKIKDTGGELD